MLDHGLDGPKNLYEYLSMSTIRASLLGNDDFVSGSIENKNVLMVQYVERNITFGNTTEVVSNESSEAGVQFSVHVFIGTILAFFGSGAVVGNGLVIWAYCRFRSLRSSSNLFIANLAFADILMSAVDFPLFVASSYSARWLFGSTMCLIYAASTGIAGLVTINTLAAISLDRFTAVVTRLNPRHGLSRSKAVIAIVFIWLYSGAWACAPLFGWGRYVLEGIGTTCTFDYVTQTWWNRSFVLSILVGNFVTPLCIIIYSYTRILKAMASIRRGLQSQSAEITIGTRRQRYFFKAEVKTTIIVIVIILVFCLSWMPYVIVALIGLFGDSSIITPLSAVIPSIIAKTSTVSNPILYSISHPKVRKRIKRLFSSVFRQASVRNSNNSPTPTQDVPQCYL